MKTQMIELCKENMDKKQKQVKKSNMNNNIKNQNNLILFLFNARYVRVYGMFVREEGKRGENMKNKFMNFFAKVKGTQEDDELKSL